jgi:hypothetical protein
MAGHVSLRGALAAVCLLLICGVGAAAEPFPFGQELLLGAAPMRPGKRMPILTVEANGDARIDLWCRTVPARVEITDMAENRGGSLARRIAGHARRRAMHARAHQGR